MGQSNSVLLVKHILTGSCLRNFSKNISTLTNELIWIFCNTTIGTAVMGNHDDFYFIAVVYSCKIELVIVQSTQYALVNPHILDNVQVKPNQTHP